MGAEELRVPIGLPIRERWLVVGSFFAFVGDDVLRLIESPILEAPLERAAGCSALLETDGLVVLIVLPKESRGMPIREVMLGLMRLLEFVLSEVEVLSTGSLTVLRVLVAGVFVPIELPMRDVMLELILLFELVVDRFVIVFRDPLVGWLFVLLEEIERLLDGVLVLIELPIRDVMPELIRPLELFLLLALLRFDWFDVNELDRVVICRPSVLEFGAVGRELIDRLDMLVLLGTRLVIARLEMLELGVLLVIARLEILLLGVRLVIALLELLLELRLAVPRLELRLDETLLELLEEFTLGAALGAGAGLEACRFCLLELLDLLLLDRVLAAMTGSATSARISNKSVKNRGWKVENRLPIPDF
ncbi:MAG: hypothetical protein A2Z38_06980 [Planctomycetes bacterium RBG_19FT_COMBO_48_8]|nr:MAG: hypothetical protein A2Z38_06980 [Planctomycetes bacterium RBG_19FT_COMBO_48_8]